MNKNGKNILGIIGIALLYVNAYNGVTWIKYTDIAERGNKMRKRKWLTGTLAVIMSISMAVTNVPVYAASAQQTVDSAEEVPGETMETLGVSAVTEMEETENESAATETEETETAETGENVTETVDESVTTGTETEEIADEAEAEEPEEQTEEQETEVVEELTEATEAAQPAEIEETEATGETETEEATEEIDEKTEMSGDWQFAWFGTSTNATCNTLVEGTGIEAGTDLTQENDDVVKMTSCTVKSDGTIDKKGGKFVATDGYDGISYYYTTLEAGKENFYLQADVTVDYIQAKDNVDGQEGFALLARDSIGENGVAASNFYTNSMATMGTKFDYVDVDEVEHLGVKDIIGYRCFDGITDTAKAPTPGKFNLYSGGLVDAADQSSVLIQKNETYRISLEETDSYYKMTYYDIDNNTELKELKSYTYYKAAAGDDPLEKIDKNKEYVGFAVARGCNATFSNIIFRTSEADESNYEKRPIEYIAPEYTITSPSTSSGAYKVVFKANADGKATVKNETTGTVLVENAEITANKAYEVETTIDKDTTFAVEFTPDTTENADRDNMVGYWFNDYTVLGKGGVAATGTETVEKAVTYRTFDGNTIYVSANGSAAGDGTENNPVDIATAFGYAKAGQTIILKAETYTIDSKLTIEKGISGTADNYITVMTEESSDEYAVLDFNRTGTGLEIWGDYWHFKRINLCNTADGAKGCQVAGDYNIIEQMNFYNNGNTGLQISSLSTEEASDWPAYNTIKNCTSMNNADGAMEDADGFAAKLTTGEGNVFDGCIAAYNADDGWDLFAKTATGSIGAVTIKNSVAYRNGFLIVGDSSTLDDSYIPKNLGLGASMEECTLKFENANYGTPVVSGGNISFTGTVINAGNGNGFKMGGSALSGNHVLKNSITYENKAKGIDSNSCPDIKAYNSITFNNGSYNVAMYSNKGIDTNFAADGLISFRTAITENDKILTIGEQVSLTNQNDLITTSDNNYLWDTAAQTSKSGSGTALDSSIFENLDTSNVPVRNADGTIDMKGLLTLTDEAKAALDAGADLKDIQADTTLWVVGDSTVCSFTDKYYMPRYGWGTQLGNYLNYHVTVENLAVSGTSSKSFLQNANYQTLLDGMQAGDYLIIGFGHNDEKTGDATFTDGNGDYQTAGSFANNLYENYVKKAQEKGVEVVLVTPIARRSALNDYSGENGHVTATGDYAKAIRDMGSALNIPVCDLTAQTIALNMQVDTDSDTENDTKYMHAWTSKKETSVDNTHTNLFGAAVNAYLIAGDLKDSTSGLKAYLKKNLADPMNSVAAWKEKSINADYVEPVYTQPATTSEKWPSYKDSNGNVWYASLFGASVSDSKTTMGADANSNMNISVTNNGGKIAASQDGIAMYYVRIPVGSSFSLKADVTVNSYNTAGKPSAQSAFGLMVRDDMYVDVVNGDLMGDYVVAGTSFQKANLLGYNTYARKNGTLTYSGGPLAAAPAAGETVSLEIASTTDGYSAKYGDNAAVIEGYDFALNSIDGDYVYVGMFVSRCVDISVSNIVLTINGTQAKDFDSYAADNNDDGNGGNGGSGDNSGSGDNGGSGDNSGSDNDSTGDGTQSVAVSGITLDKSSLSFDTIGKTQTLTATVAPDNASDKTVTWTSSNEKVATVADGVVKAVGNGTAVITAKAGDKTAECTVKVSQKTKSLSIQIKSTKVSGKSLPVTKGQSYTLKAVVSPKTTAAENAKVKWSTSNKKVATVSSKGKVKIKATGTVKITAKTADGKKATVTLKAKKAVVKVSKLTIKGNKQMKVKAKQTLKATVSPITAKNQKVTWKSSNKKVATVSSKGVVTAKKKGTVTITATTKDGSKKTAKIKITVKK